MAAAAADPIDVDVWGTDGALATLESGVGQLVAHRDQVSRAAAGNVGSQAGAKLGATAAHMTVAIRSIEDGIHRLRAVRDGNAGAAPATSGPLPIGRVIATENGPAVSHGIDVSALTTVDEAAFPVPVTTDGDPFDRKFLTVRSSSLVTDLVRQAIVRLGLEQHSGTWCLHLEGRPLTATTAGEAGLTNGAELVLLQV